MKLVVGISGASGSVYGIRVLEALRALPQVESHLILSDWGARTLELETGRTPDEVRALAGVSYPEDDLSAPVASGSFPVDGMIVAPCSMKTAAGIACGYADNLLLRAADVCIKEQRRLVLLARESPLSAIHLENLLKLARLGAVILPPVPAFYARPATLDEAVDQTVAQALGYFGIELPGRRRWGTR